MRFPIDTVSQTKHGKPSPDAKPCARAQWDPEAKEWWVDIQACDQLLELAQDLDEDLVLFKDGSLTIYDDYLE